MNQPCPHATPMSFTTLKSAAFSIPSAITCEPALSAPESAKRFMDADDVELDRCAGLCRGGEEIGRRFDQRALRTANQGLESEHPALAETEDRLEDGRHAPLFQHPAQLLRDFAAYRARPFHHPWPTRSIRRLRGCGTTRASASSRPRRLPCGRSGDSRR